MIPKVLRFSVSALSFSRCVRETRGSPHPHQTVKNNCTSPPTLHTLTSRPAEQNNLTRLDSTNTHTDLEPRCSGRTYFQPSEERWSRSPPITSLPSNPVSETNSMIFLHSLIILGIPTGRLRYSISALILHRKSYNKIIQQWS